MWPPLGEMSAQQALTRLETRANGSRTCKKFYRLSGVPYCRVDESYFPRLNHSTKRALLTPMHFHSTARGEMPLAATADALIAACKSGDARSAARILRRDGSLVNCADSDGRSPLF